MMDDDDKGISQEVSEAKATVGDIGGWQAFKSGQWFGALVQKSFRNYWDRANVEYFEKKYGTSDKEKLAKKLTSVATRNSAILGGITGATMSADEIAALATLGEAGVGLPANVAIAATALGTEVVVLMRIQLQLVANLGKLYGVPLDPDDPEDILTILAFAVGGAAAEEAGRMGMKIGGKLAGKAVRKVISKEVLAALKRLGIKVGVRITQRAIATLAVPVVSVFLGAGWDYFATKAVASIATKHFKVLAAELASVTASAD
jgi:uncharacterized protein (DUF697 family)